MHDRAIEPLIDDFDGIDVNEKWALLAGAVLGGKLNKYSHEARPLERKGIGFDMEPTETLTSHSGELPLRDLTAFNGIP